MNAAIISPVQAIKNLSASDKLNDIGLPLGFYRADLLPYSSWQSHTAIVEEANEKNLTSQLDNELHQADDGVYEPVQNNPIQPRRIAGFPAHELESAYVPLDFVEGYPTLPNGMPFWSQLEHEPALAYELFKKYQLMELLGDASATEADLDAGYSESLQNVRSFVGLVPSVATLPVFKGRSEEEIARKIQEYAILYYWTSRVKAYDMFKIAQYQKTQELRALRTTDEHYLFARRLRKQLEQYLADQEDCWDQMTPKVAVDLFKLAAMLERVSVGLPASSPADKNEPAPVGASMEVFLRKVGININQAPGTTVVDVSDGQTQAAVRSVLGDPAAIQVIQDMFLKFSQGT